MSINQQLTLNIRADDQASGVVRNAANNIEKSTNKASGAMSKLNVNTLRAGVGIASIGAGAVSLATSFSVLDKAQTKVAASTKGAKAAEDTLNLSITTLKQNNLSLTKSEQKLIRLRESGTATSQQLALAEEDLAIKTQKVADQEGKVATNRENLEVTSLRLRDAEVDLSDTRTNFVANLAPQILSLTLGAVTAVSSLTTANLGNVKSLFTRIGAHKLETVSLGAVNVATRKVTLSMKLMQIAMGPIGIAILGITSLFTLWATNTFGLRDKINALGQQVLEFTEVHLKPLADILKFLNEKVIIPLTSTIDKFLNPSLDHIVESADDATESVNGATESVNGATESVNGATESVNGATESVNGATESVNGATESVNGATESVNGATESVNGATESVNGATESVNGATESVNGATESVNGATESVNGATESVNGATESVNGFDQALILNTQSLADMEEETQAMIEALNPTLIEAASLSEDAMMDFSDANDKTTESLKGVEATVARNIELYGVMGRAAIEAGVVTAGSIEQAGKIITSAARGIDKELRQVITTLNSLRGQQTEVRKRGSLAGARGNTLAANARREEAKNIGNQIQSARARGLSLALAGGSAFSDIFREFYTGSGGIRYVNTDDGILGVTPSGTSFATRKRPGSLRTVQQAIDNNLGSFDRTRARELLGSSQKRFSSWKPEYQNISREQFFNLQTAQHGFTGSVNKPTLFLAGEAGREQVNITPSGGGLTARDRDMIETMVRVVVREVLLGIEGTQNFQGGLIG